MEEQLILLEEIKYALWVLIYLIGIGVFLNAVRTIVTTYKTIKNNIEDVFTNTAGHMYDNGEYDELIEHCQDYLKKKPEAEYGYWFLGKAYYKKENYEEALNNFNKTSEICPSWDTEWVEPYIKRINEKINNLNK